MNYQVEILMDKASIPYPLLLLADETKEAIDKYINDCTIMLLFITDHESPIGVVALHSINQNILEIKNIAIDTHYQKQDYGKVLVDEAKAYAKSHQYIDLIVGTGDHSHDAFAFYKRMGFEPYGVRANFFKENYSEPIIENGHALKNMIMMKYVIE